MLLDQGPSWRQRSQPQPVNQAQDHSEQGSWYGDLRHLERDIATVASNRGADLDQLLPQRGQRPVFDLLRQPQCLLWVISGHFSYPSVMSALGGKADIATRNAS